MPLLAELTLFQIFKMAAGSIRFVKFKRGLTGWKGGKVHRRTDAGTARPARRAEHHLGDYPIKLPIKLVHGDGWFRNRFSSLALQP